MRNASLLLLSFFLCTITISSQEIDSLSSKSYKELNSIIQNNLFENPDISFEITKYYIDKSLKNKNNLEHFRGLVIQLDNKIWLHMPYNFNIEDKKLIAFAQQNNLEKELMISYNKIANTFFYNGIWEKAIETYYKSLALATTQNNLVYKHLNLKQIGYFNFFTGKLDESIRIQNQAYALLSDSSQNQDSVFLSKKYKLEINALELITRTYLFAKKADSAKVYNDKALQLTFKEKDSCSKARFVRNKAKIAILKSKFEEAKIYLKDYNKSCTAAIDYYINAMDYGEIYIGLKQYDKAITALNKGLEIYPLNNKNSAFAKDYIKVLAKAHKYKGNQEEANMYFEKFVNANEKYGEIMNAVSVNIKKQEVANFKAELDAIEAEKQQQQNYFKYLSLAATLIVLGLLFLLLKFYKRKKANEIKFNKLLEKVNEAKAKQSIVDTKDEVLEQNNSLDINQDTKQQILEGLLKLEEQEYFLKQECNSYNVAKKIKTNTSYLSKVINSHYQKNFNTYINDLRINYAIVRLKNESQFRAFSIQSIAEELGYKSTDSFTKYFKQHTGLNPSFFIKQLNTLS